MWDLRYLNGINEIIPMFLEDKMVFAGNRLIEVLNFFFLWENENWYDKFTLGDLGVAVKETVEEKPKLVGFVKFLPHPSYRVNLFLVRSS